MTRSARRLWQRALWLAAYGFAGSLMFMLFLRGQRPIDDGDLLTAALVSVFLAASWTFSERAILPPTRAKKLIPAVLVRTAALSASSIGSVLLGVLLANVLKDGWEAALNRFVELIHTGEVARGCTYGLLILLVLVFMGSVSQKLGPGVMRNWLLGQYHEPKEEQCVFLFLDVRGSTALAETLGDRRFSALIRDAFSDMTPPLLEHGAFVSHFIGDEVVLYWPVRRASGPDASFARCFFAIKALMAQLAPKYLELYGSAPSFKAGAHWGNVIATNVGDIKSEIVFHGDVLNVAARLERLCNEEGADFLISGDLAIVLANEEWLVLEERGERVLRGKEAPIKIFAVSERANVEDVLGSAS